MGNTRRRLIATMGAAAVIATMAGTTPAHADASADIWTVYAGHGSLEANMQACKNSLIPVNDACFGLQDHEVLGLVDGLLATDEINDVAHIRYDDLGTLPPPETPTNAIIRAWNRPGIDKPTMLIGAGTPTDQTANEMSGMEFYLNPGQDLNGGPLDGYGGYGSGGPGWNGGGWGGCNSCGWQTQGFGNQFPMMGGWSDVNLKDGIVPVTWSR
ncbi:hypothetical protein [Streptomyces natalensis]|uniref:Uncharacterized protein n=1 Tax=Streptomyces natalensis ATCC 27448 TaxID=1240678 RepID=A0A0D7CHX0_9ACTN|nr:hypothetical protein [Streptomyces natalensis]KIZ15778.1 hypothetical protein SNA_20870 [Streptomyces natalensis ATCC 27448]